MADPHQDRHRSECERLGCVDFYDQLIEDGNKSGFAAMLAQRRPPGALGTDRAFLEGTHSWGDKLWTQNAEGIHDTAKKAGISTQGKVYKGGLGKPNDPMAWVSGRDDVIAACKAKGLSSTGSVNYQSPPQKPKRKVLASDICDNYVRGILATEPETREKVKRKPKLINEVRERVIAKHGKKGSE